jgi:hypothetical protein
MRTGPHSSSHCAPTPVRLSCAYPLPPPPPHTHTQAAVVGVPLVTLGGPQAPNLCALLLVGDFFLGGVIAASLTKLPPSLHAM